MQPATPIAPPVHGPTGRDGRRAVVPAPRTGGGAADAPAPATSASTSTSVAGVLPAPGHRRLVGSLVVGPPAAVLVAVLAADASGLSAPASVLVAGTSAGAASLLVRVATLGLLVAAALGVHGLLLGRGARPWAASGVVVVGAAPFGGLVLVEPGPAATAAGLALLVRVVPSLRRRGARVAAALALPALLVAAGAAAAHRGPDRGTSPLPDVLAGAAAEVSRAATGLGAAGAVGAVLPLLVLAAVLARGRARTLLSLGAGGVGLVAALLAARG